MTIVRISKQRVIKAIMTEPTLRPGNFMNTSDAKFMAKLTAMAKKRNLKDDGPWVDVFDIRNKVTLGDTVAKDCPVCAVGSVMRNILSPSSSFDKLLTAVNKSLATESRKAPAYYRCTDNSFDEEQFADYCAHKSYMHALSLAFESLAAEAARRNGNSSNTDDLSRHQIRRIRLRVCSLVQEYFPRTIEININGAEPARDVALA